MNPSALRSGQLHEVGLIRKLCPTSSVLGIALVAIGLTKYGVPIGKLVPLYNMNMLIAVLLALWIFSKWKEVNVMKLLIGSALIVIGGILVTKA